MRNAIVAATIAVAEQYISAFGLDTKHWRVFRHSDNPAGRCFDRLVIIRPHWRVTPEQIAAFEDSVHSWFSRVDSDGHITVL
ncbi:MULTISPECIES: hypothetical protein [unclassified Bradyrhizobium]|uniref:hypothetical protein n=1 Tax=unclassified Bradyrhizobium TaxID=2631580 RepID=UPI0029170E8F|nr:MULTISPECIES: hypothetical protein [unclassified Bradyrhizobium]